VISPSTPTTEHESQQMSLSHRQPVVIACGADDQYVQLLAVMRNSALINLSSDRAVALYIIDGGIDPDHKDNLMRSWNRRSISVHWISPLESSCSGLPLWGRMPVTMVSPYLAAAAAARVPLRGVT
jgi:hypothetical protein